MGAAWPVLCLLWGMVALTRLPCCTHEDKQAAGGDGNISLKMIEQGITGGYLSLSFCAWDRTVCLYGNKLSIGCGVSFSHLKKMLAFSRQFFFFLENYLLKYLSVCLSKDWFLLCCLCRTVDVVKLPILHHWTCFYQRMRTTLTSQWLQLSHANPALWTSNSTTPVLATVGNLKLM